MAHKSLSTAVMAFAVLFITAFSASGGEKKYYHFKNGFGDFALCPAAYIDNNCLDVVNKADTIIMNLVGISGNGKFSKISVAARLANAANKPGNAKKSSCGLVLDYTDGLNYTVVEVKSGNTAIYEPHDRRFSKVILRHVVNGVTVKEYSSAPFFSGVNHYNGFNTLKTVVSDDGGISVCVGNKTLTKVLEVNDSSLCYNIKSVGYFTGAHAHTRVMNIMVDTEEAVWYRLAPKYSSAQIDSTLKMSVDAMEGCWSYLDRKLNKPEEVKMGGKYKLVVVKSAAHDGYDLLYLDGAITNRDKWHKYMLKGTLSESGIPGTYNLVWYDSAGECISDDCYATVDEDGIMELVVPIHNSSFRLIKTK